MLNTLNLKIAKTKRYLKKNWLNVLFILPLIIFVLGFTIIPILQTVILSFRDPYDVSSFSLESYRYVFAKGQLLTSIYNTLIVTGIALTIQVGLGFAIAMLLKQSFIGKGIARAFVLLPMGVPTLVSGVAMLFVFGTSGYLNEILYQLDLITTPFNFTGEKLLSLFVVSVADSWKVMPMVVMLFLSGLESIPKSLYEAGNVDGTNAFQRLRFITIPQLKSTTTMIVLLRAVSLLMIFDMPMVLLGFSTPFLQSLAYSEYKFGNNTYSAAISVILLLMIIVFVVIYLFLFDREGGKKDAK